MSGDKQELRRRQLERLKGLSPETVAEESRAACEALMASGLLDVGPADVVAAYLPLSVDRGAEADPWPAMDGLGRRVAVPDVDWAAGKFGLRRVPEGFFWDELERDRHGLRSPPSKWPMVEAGEVGAVVVPGLAFDSSGGRLGRGAGMYDRFLKGLKAGTPMVGLALRAQIVDATPMDDHDVRMTAVVGPDGLVWRERLAR